MPSATRFPYEDEYFSTVLCCELIEHLTADPMHMMAEINRILKPGGHLVLTTPNLGSLRAIAAILEGYHPGFFPAYIRPPAEGEEPEARHNREYTPREVARLLVDSGFEIALLETGPFREEPKPEHEWVKHLLARYQLSPELRGDGIYAVGRKIGRMRDALSGLAISMSHVDYGKMQVRTRRTDAAESRWPWRTSRAQAWTPREFSIGWQFFDPETNFFILEGAWAPLEREVAPGESASFDISIPFPPEPGGYQVYVSPIEESGGWAYARGEPFLRIVAETSGGEVRVVEQEIATAAQTALAATAGELCRNSSCARSGPSSETSA